MMRTGDQRGMTLIETVVSVTIIVILLAATATLFSILLKTYAKDKAVQDLQRQGDAVSQNVSQNLKEATRVDTANSNLTTNPNSLSVFLSSGQTRRYYVTASQLHYVDEDGSDQLILQPGTTVTSLTFTPTSDQSQQLKSVRVALTLSHTRYGQTVSLNLATTVTTRPQ